MRRQVILEKWAHARVREPGLAVDTGGPVRWEGEEIETSPVERWVALRDACKVLHAEMERDERIRTLIGQHEQEKHRTSPAAEVVCTAACCLLPAAVAAFGASLGLLRLVGLV